MNIIGLFLVKNEDLHIEWVIRNVIDFCDKIYICDNYSTDGTWEILKRLKVEFSKIEIHRVTQPKDSHRFVESYAGTPTWVFAVDGDEVYDPQGLKRLRQMLLEGEYSQFFKLVGNTLHVDKINHVSKVARGYLAPPAKNVTKLYNFNAVTVWKNPPYERLHGGEVIFRDGYDAELRMLFDREYQWENSPFRCLHFCFVQRSSQENNVEKLARKNIDENPKTFTQFRWTQRILQLLKIDKLPEGPSKWKLDNYALGEKVERSIEDF